MRKFWSKVIEQLEEERAQADLKQKPLSKAFVEKAAKASDQIRRDLADEIPVDPIPGGTGSTRSADPPRRSLKDLVIGSNN